MTISHLILFASGLLLGFSGGIVTMLLVLARTESDRRGH